MVAPRSCCWAGKAPKERSRAPGSGHEVGNASGLFELLRLVGGMSRRRPKAFHLGGSALISLMAEASQGGKKPPGHA